LTLVGTHAFGLKDSFGRNHDPEIVLTLNPLATTNLAKGERTVATIVFENRRVGSTS